MQVIIIILILVVLLYMFYDPDMGKEESKSGKKEGFWGYGGWGYGGWGYGGWNGYGGWGWPSWGWGYPYYYRYPFYGYRYWW